MAGDGSRQPSASVVGAVVKGSQVPYVKRPMYGCECCGYMVPKTYRIHGLRVCADCRALED